MKCYRSNPPLLLLCLLVTSTLANSHLYPLRIHEAGGERERGGADPSEERRFLAETPPSDNNTVTLSLVLAANQTYRKDPLNNNQYYTGGWNISNQHYWSSVSFTAAPFFAIAAAWFVLFALLLFIICIRHCCCRKVPYGYSRTAYALALALLILFTIAAIIGCGFLYAGQGKFNSSTKNTLDYCVNQAELTVTNLKDVSGYLDTAKKLGVEGVSLPEEIRSQIDQIGTMISSATNFLSTKTRENSRQIRDVLDRVRLVLVVLAAVMLSLAFIGFLLSIFGLERLVYFLVIVGWIFVTGTFILCGVFLLLHNVVGDTCVAMHQWVQNPTAHSALDDILPCVDNATAQQTLVRAKDVTHRLVGIIDQVIINVSNANFPPEIGPPLYFNQSGPPMPLLCNPYNADLSDRQCASGEVDFNNATQVWKNYVCQVSDFGICTTTGRIIPAYYEQMVAATNVSYGLRRYAPFLVDLQDCTFVRETFTDIYEYYCPGLEKYTQWIYSGLVSVSAGVMLSLIFWVVYARERRHRVYTKKLMSNSWENRDKPPL